MKKKGVHAYPMLQGMMGGMGGVMGNNPNNVSAYAASSMGGGFNGCMEVNDNPFANQGFPPNRMGSAWSDRQGYYQADDAARTTAVFKRQVATMAMNEASTAFKDMEDAFSLANEVMSQYPEYNHPLVSEAIAHAKKYQSVAMFKLRCRRGRARRLPMLTTVTSPWWMEWMLPDSTLSSLCKDYLVQTLSLPSS